ncbi:hypothetical protein N9V24_03660 [Pseudomonadota bacterium]|nr:hypothetical protein [Pseudomonadota bacterium]
MSNYWNNIDECLSKLVNDGYCYLPSIKNILDLENISISIDKDISENIYSENIPSHLSFCNEFGITNILGQKLFEIAKDLFNYKGLISNQYHIARKVSPGLKAEAYRGHFDSHLFTLVMPIQIPKKISDDSVGDLIFVPNARSMPNHEIINFFQKIYFKKYASKKGFDKLKENKEVLTEDFIEYKPLLFIGMKTFHGNLPVSQIVESHRLTLLSHFFDPSPPWGVGNILRTLRKR